MGVTDRRRTGTCARDPIWWPTGLCSAAPVLPRQVGDGWGTVVPDALSELLKPQKGCWAGRWPGRMGAMRGGHSAAFPEPPYTVRVPAGERAGPGMWCSWRLFIGVGPGGWVGGLGVWGAGASVAMEQRGGQVQAALRLPRRPAPTAVALGWAPVSGLKSAPLAQACPGTWQRGDGINTGKLEGLPELTRSPQLQAEGMRE